MDHFWDRKLRTRRKKLRRFHFLNFPRTTSKTPSRFTEIPNVNLARENLGWDEHGNFTFPDENHQNASRRGIFLPNQL